MVLQSVLPTKFEGLPEAQQMVLGLTSKLGHYPLQFALDSGISAMLFLQQAAPKAAMYR